MKRVCFFTQGHADFDLIKGLKSTSDYELKTVIFPEAVKPGYNRIMDVMTMGINNLSSIYEENDIYVISSRAISFFPNFDVIRRELLSRKKRVIEIPETTYKNKETIYKPIVLVNVLGSRLSQVGTLLNFKRLLEKNVGEVSLFSNSQGLLYLGEAVKYERAHEINESPSSVCIIHTEKGLINPFSAEGYDDEINGLLFDSKVDYVVTIVPFNLWNKDKEYEYRELFKGRYGVDIDLYCVDKIWYDTSSGNLDEMRTILLEESIVNECRIEREGVLLLSDDYYEVANRVFKGLVSKLASKSDYKIV